MKRYAFFAALALLALPTQGFADDVTAAVTAATAPIAAPVTEPAAAPKPAPAPQAPHMIGPMGPQMMHPRPMMPPTPPMPAKPAATPTTITPTTISPVALKPAFPMTIKIDEVVVTLNADGTATGDGTAFRKALADLKGSGYGGVNVVVAWLIAKELP